ncbi:MAG: aldehyde dehydrogenase, partial [Chloroflexota bacterium]|nr:aldehyde dehydrogenase [Chloroflexota bacterium]
KEGLYEYVKPTWKSVAAQFIASSSVDERDGHDEFRSHEQSAASLNGHNGHMPTFPPIDRTPKLFIKGKQVRPDSGYSRDVYDPQHRVIGQVGEGNRKDIRNAVEAAHAASGWANGTTHNRAQILYYIAENLAVREDEFARRIVQQTGCTYSNAVAEVEASISRLFSYAAWADKYEGMVHRPPLRGVVLAMKEAMGVIGITCPDEHPLLGFVSLIAPAVAMGNTVVVIPSETSPLSATDFYQVLETSDVPDGVVNIVIGERNALSQVLSDHDDVEAMWYFGSEEGSQQVEFASAGNMKRTWVNYGHSRNWLDVAQGEGEEFLREATQVKNIWVPYGE